MITPLISSLISIYKYPEVVKPPAAITLPSELNGFCVYRYGSYFEVSHKPSDLWDTTLITSVFYVDSTRPNDAGNGLTWATAKQSIQSAITLANASGVASRIMVKAGVYNRFISIGQDSLPKTLTVPIVLQAVYGRVVTGPFDTLTWTKSVGLNNTYQAARSNVQLVCNITMLNHRGDYLRYPHVASAAVCDVTPGSWYTDNVTIYVHHSESVPVTNNNLRAYVNAINADFKTPHNLYIRGFDFEGGNNSPLTLRDGENNVVILEECTAKYGAVNPLSTIAGKDGVQVLGCKLFAAYNCQTSSNGKDGFNIHAQAAVKPFGLIVNSKSFDNGIVLTSVSNNGVTYHDGCSGLGVGNTYLGSIGANHGSVNTNTKVWEFGTVAGDSEGDIINGGSGNYGGFGMWDGAGELWLDSCTDVGCNIGVYAGGGGAIVYLRNHKGTGQHVGDVRSY